MSTSVCASSYDPNVEVGPAIISHPIQDANNIGTHQQPIEEGEQSMHSALG